MSIIVEQWMDKLAIVEKFEKAEYVAQTSRNLNDKERSNQMRICRNQVLRGRDEMDRMTDRMTEEEANASWVWYVHHLGF